MNKVVGAVLLFAGVLIAGPVTDNLLFEFLGMLVGMSGLLLFVSKPKEIVS